MRVRAASLVAGVVVGLTILASAARGGDDAPPAGGAASDTSGASATLGAPLDLSIRGRALGIAADPVTTPSLDLETGRAPTGAGSLRMPSATAEVGRGVYVGLMPSCIPGVDDVGVPPGRRIPRARR